jgi:hypothetical protein
MYMQCAVHTTIGGYAIASTVGSYNQWYFMPVTDRRNDAGDDRRNGASLK